MNVMASAMLIKFMTACKDKVEKGRLYFCSDFGQCCGSVINWPPGSESRRFKEISKKKFNILYFMMCYLFVTK